MSVDEMLNLKFMCGDLNKEVSIREYLKELLFTLWDEQESFSGKRPFGNSGWQYDLFECLVRNGIVTGTLDEEGRVDDVDRKHAHDVVKILIGAL